MSIVKNDKVSYHTDVTIRRLPKGEVTSFGTTSCVFKHYVQMNNRYFDTPWYLGVGESVFIKAEIEQNAEGYFYGHNRNASGSNNGHSIRKNGANIEWLNGNTVVVSKPWSAGVHLFGWVGTISDNTNGCKPWYDGEIISDTLVRGGGRGEYARIGGLIEGTSTTTIDNKYCIHSTASWAIRVYEVTAYSFSYYSGVARFPRMYHMYAASSSDGTVVYMAEPRYSLTVSSINDGGAVSGVTRSSSVVDFPDGVSGYGIQFADLREITGSNYTQLLAVLTDDDARKASENADVPYVINGRNFAFKINTVPSGATTSGGVGYADGDIIRGRRPKWDIWNDAIKFGKYATKETSASAPRHIHFNIFKNNKGETLNDMLGVFDGYNTGNSTHEPSFSIKGNVNFEWHNGFLANIAYDDRIIGNPTPTTSNGTDEQTIFRLRRETSGMGRVVLGNLPLWNYTASEQSDGVSNPLTNMRCIGGGVVLEWQDGSGWARFASMVEFTEQMSGGNIVPLSSNSNQETMDKFRTNGFGGDMFVVGKRIEQLRRHFIIHNTNTMNMRANLVLATEHNIDVDSNLIECSNLIPTKLSTFSGVFDNRVSLATLTPTGYLKIGDRTIYASAVNDVVINGTAYELWAQGSGKTQSYPYLYQFMLSHNTTNYGNAIALPVALLSANTEQTPLTLFDVDKDGEPISEKPIIAVYAMVTAWDVTNRKIAGRYYGFASMLCADLYEYYYNIQGGGYTTTYHSMDVPCANDIVKRVSRGQTADAILMWKDLFKNFGGDSSIVRPSNPITIYARAFALATAPHAWDTYHSSFDTSMEADSINLSTPGLKFVFHNNDRLIPMGTSMLVGYEVFADMWISLWDTNTGSRVTSQWSKLNGRTIKLYGLINDDMHDPSTGRGGKIAELASFAILNGTFHDDTTLAVQNKNIYSGDDCMCNIQANVTYPDFAILGTAGALEQTNMIHIRITSFDSAIKPLKGAMYYVDVL